MKTPIEPSEIRAGDTIEREWLGTVLRMPVARVQGQLLYSSQGYCMGVDDDAKCYLVDRPKPAVELPTEPTLGWLTRYVGEESSGLGCYRTRLGRFGKSNRSADSALEVDSSGAFADTLPDVTAFTPATAIPTEALDELHLWWMQANVGDIADTHIGDFFDAVDKAGEQS